MGEMKFEIQGIKGVEEEEDGSRIRERERNDSNTGNEKVRIRVDEDRISSLPDEIIHQILSFNDTKYAVQTSVLSKRWRFIWKTLPYLSFATSSFRILPKFSKFVNRVFSLRNNWTEVSSVYLYFRGPVSQKFVEKIVSYAMSHNVQKVEIFACSPDRKGNHQFPLSLFSSESLKHLKIKSSNNYDPHLVPLPQFPWNFPGLTILCLEDIWLCDYNPQDLFSKCVNLKKLTLKGCATKSTDLTIITPQLENLSITCSYTTRLVISAPHLSTFYCGCHFDIPSLSAGDPQFLDKVTLQLTIYVPETKERRQQQAKKLFTLFEELRNAKFLTLHSSIIEVLATVPDLLETQLSPFSNLKYLEIKGFEKRNTMSTDSANHVIQYLLNGSPTATIILQLPQAFKPKVLPANERPKKPRERVMMGTSKVEYRTQLGATKERMTADVKAQSQGHNTERAQIDRYQAEVDASRELIKAEKYHIRNKMSSRTSMATTSQGQPLMDANCATAVHASASKQEEPMKDVQGWMDGATINKWLRENVDMHTRHLLERIALLARHKAEMKELHDRHGAELNALNAEQNGAEF